MSGVLSGIRVLDFGRYIAGPFCATLLADMGAEVIRIEKVDGSEDRYTVPLNAAGEGAGFVQMGRNKLGLTLNPTKPEGREVVRRLVTTADVVVANLPAPTLTAMGIDYESLRAIKADIILTTVSAFGSTGPYAAKVGFDAVAQAMSGNLHMSGFPGEPRKSYVPYCDFGTATLAAFGTLAAIIHKMKTGEGQHVEGSLLGTALTIANALTIEQEVLSPNREGTGNRGQTMAPSDVFTTTDGWVMVQVVGQPVYERWARLMGDEEWLTDARFATDQARGDNAVAISERMARWCSDKSNAEILAILEEARVPCGEVLTAQQCLDNEHVRDTGAFVRVNYPGFPKAAPLACTPVRLSATPGEIRFRAPTLGEHTRGILAELGYAEAQIEELREKRVV